MTGNRFISVVAFAGLVSMVGCGSDTVEPRDVPAHITALSGDGQAGNISSVLTNPLVVAVTDAKGSPFAGATVLWQVTGGTGALSNETTNTDSEGRASVTWTLGPELGNQSVEARISNAESAAAVFSALASPNTPSPPPPVNALSVWPDTNVIFTGMTRILSLSVVRGSTSGSEPAQSWSTSDASVATVENGVVTAVGSGHATVTASLEGHVSPGIDVFVLPAPTPALRFSTWSGSCGLTTSGLLYCWDTPFVGMPGPFDRCRRTTTHGNFPYRCSEIPRLVSADLRFKALTGDASGGCALTIDGALYCWGGNAQGQAGLGFTDDLTRGLTRVPTSDEFVEVANGAFTRCARRIDGVILCWGSNFRGDAGIGLPDASYSSPVVQPTPINTSVKFVKLGSGGNCGLAADSTAYCWGSFVGGDSAAAGCNTGCSLSPVQVKSEKLVDLGTSFWYCGIGVSGRAYCWGYHSQNPYRYPEPQEIPNPGFRSLEPGLYAVDASGAAFKIDQYAGLWRFRPLDTGQLRYKKYSGDCGVALDDKLYCGTIYGPPGRLIPGQ